VSGLDVTIVVVYLVALFAWAVYIGLKETAEDYLVFSRKAPLLLVVFSIISTWVGVGTTVATASSGYSTGISLGLTAALGGIVGALSAAWIAPRLKAFGDRYGAHTIGDFLAARYSATTRFVGSVLILVVYTLLTAGQFVGMAALLQVWTQQSFMLVVAFAAVSTVLYTAFAGIKSDFYTDVAHFVLMTIVLFAVLLPVSLRGIGGPSALGQLPESYFDPFAYGGIAFFIGGLVFGAGSVFVMMELWQRIYASSSGRNARRALVTSIAIIVLFYAVAAVLGMVARLALPDLEDADQALFRLMVLHLPTGILGIAVAAFLAIFISTLNSTIMVSSATLAKDIFYPLCMQGRNTGMLLVTRLATLVCGSAALLLAFAVPDIVVLSVNGMFLLLVLLPAVLGGLFVRRVTAKAAATSVAVGILVTIIFFFIDSSIAFVPGFLGSALALLVGSLVTRHSESEDLSIVSRWQHAADPD